ncbi:hypothetical protein F5141DRAFT_1154549 [Pisolithus sp. B1]|nr:hypothetical protein F5141DRAFT_1154549 [Pisolithus sp. B1]
MLTILYFPLVIFSLSLLVRPVPAFFPSLYLLGQRYTCHFVALRKGSVTPAKTAQLFRRLEAGLLWLALFRQYSGAVIPVSTAFIR